MTPFVAMWLAAAPVMHPGDGDSALGTISLREGVLLVRGAGRERYRSTPDMEVLGWAPLERDGVGLVLVWFLRRDGNVRGVVEHRSGWMDYGQTPWLNHHLAVLGAQGPAVTPRWVSSGLDADAAWVLPPATVLLRRRGVVERWRFAGWTLEREPGDAPSGPEVETRLVELASVGDVMLGRATAQVLDRLGVERAFGEVRPLLTSADLRLGNLESCFTTDEMRREGPRVFFAPRRHLVVLSFLGFDGLSLANNHCDDADARTSAETLGRAGIAGLLPWRPARFVRRGVPVDVVALTALPGEAAEVMTAEHAALLRRLDAPLRVALVHWGLEYRHEPTAEQRAVGAWLLRHGVTLVLGSGPHVVQPVEVTDGGVVAFSQGNFVFDQEGAPGVPLAAQRGQAVVARFHPRLGLATRTVDLVIERRAVVRPR